mmetsp:Transcript_48868/g.146065  ORF Transcript_48868/g.146065 Transcript_48868/m.146065 type:complete len:230 (+) Transcript_48868:316-1005(+)
MNDLFSSCAPKKGGLCNGSASIAQRRPCLVRGEELIPPTQMHELQHLLLLQHLEQQRAHLEEPGEARAQQVGNQCQGIPARNVLRSARLPPPAGAPVAARGLGQREDLPAPDERRCQEARDAADLVGREVVQLEELAEEALAQRAQEQPCDLAEELCGQDASKPLRRRLHLLHCSAQRRLRGYVLAILSYACGKVARLQCSSDVVLLVPQHRKEMVLPEPSDLGHEVNE